jgi:CRISP-associated protein Cas1
MAFVSAKIANCRTVLLRAIRDNPDIRALVQPAAESLAVSLEAIIARQNTNALTVDTLRGMEGDCARIYFEVFDHLILVNKEDFGFRGRSRRPPLDRVNALRIPGQGEQGFRGDRENDSGVKTNRIPG